MSTQAGGGSSPWGSSTPGGSSGLGSTRAQTDANLKKQLEEAEKLVAQGATRLAGEEARADVLQQQLQDMQAQQAPSVIAALDAQTSNKIPKWSASQSDFSAEMWMTQVKLLRTVNKWSADQTKEACYLSLEGSAAIWKQAKIREEGEASLATFELFEAAFLKRFKRLKTPAESVQIVAQLRQTSTESCLDFYDRCSNSIHEAHEEDLVALANKPQEREGYNTAIKRTIRQHFVAGLVSEIKSQINAKLQSLDTKEKLLDAATEIEAAVRPKSSSSALMALGAHQQEEDSKLRDLKAELDAIKSRFGNLNLQASRGGARKKRRTGNNSTNQAAAARRAAMSTAEKVAERRRWAFCTKCRQWGLHYHDECPRSQSEISRLTPQHKDKGEPSHKPFDKAF